MPIMVEDGTQVAGAEAWADLAAFDAWAVRYHGAATTQSDALREAAVRRAALYMNALPWKGAKTGGRGQLMAWPRTGATDVSSASIADHEIPTEVVTAQHMLAWIEVGAPGTLNPSVAMATAKTLTKSGDNSWTPTGAEKDSIDAHRTIVLGALDQIAGLLAGDITDVNDRDPAFLRALG